MTLPSRGLGRWLTLRGVTKGAAISYLTSWGRHLGVVGAAILDRKSWVPPSWIWRRGGRHLGSDVVTSLTLKCHTYYCSLCWFFLNILWNIPWKWNNLVSLRPNYFISIGHLRTGAGRGVRANPMNPTDDSVVHSIRRSTRHALWKVHL